MTRVVFNNLAAQQARRLAGDTSPEFAFSLPGVIFVDGPVLSEDTRIHEEVHQSQWRRWLYLGYVFRYAAEMALRLAQYQNSRRAYLAHSMEREAYAAQNAYRTAHGLLPVGVV